jgi:hypothetical protein
MGNKITQAVETAQSFLKRYLHLTCLAGKSYDHVPRPFSIRQRDVTASIKALAGE